MLHEPFCARIDQCSITFRHSSLASPRPSPADINKRIAQSVLLLQVPETLPEGVLEKMHAPPKPDVPVVDVHDLPNADGFVFAFPSKHLY